jgi:hypothetical protein
MKLGSSLRVLKYLKPMIVWFQLFSNTQNLSVLGSWFFKYSEPVVIWEIKELRQNWFCHGKSGSASRRNPNLVEVLISYHNTNVGADSPKGRWQCKEVDTLHNNVHPSISSLTSFSLPLYYSISNSAQNVTLQKYFSHPSLVLLFSNLTDNTKTRTANRWEITNSKAPGWIITIRQSETGSSCQIISITLFSIRC